MANPFFITDDGDCLFFDIFYKDNCVYIISPIYDKPYDTNDILVSIHNRAIAVSDKKIKDYWEPISIYLYNYKSKDKTIEVTVTYKNITKSFILNNNISSKANLLTLTTLFKNDYELFPMFYSYYLKQGVSHFYMYYNGILTEDIKSIFNLPNVTVIEWNFKYWNSSDKKYPHHAQVGQMHHALYKYGKDYTDYMIFCDLDEYLSIPKNTLVEYISKHNNIKKIVFGNKWSRTLDNTIPTKFPSSFYTAEKLGYKDRSKVICCVNSTDLLAIHYAYGLNEYSLSELFDMYHFCNWGHRNRIFDDINIKIDL